MARVKDVKEALSLHYRASKDPEILLLTLATRKRLPPILKSHEIARYQVIPGRPQAMARLVTIVPEVE